MPVSRRGKLRHTKDQWLIARQASALDYARSRGYPLVGRGNYYTMEGHDSMIFGTDGWWNWNSRQLNGRALEFCQQYEGMSMQEAVIMLAEGPEVLQAEQAEAARITSQLQAEAARMAQSGGTQAPSPATQQASPTPWLQPSPPPAPEPKRPFELPLRAENDKRVYTYLCKDRGIAPEVVQEMVQQGRLYESVKILDSGKELHNACFVSYDPDGKPCGAFQRSLYDGGKPFKRDVVGSNKDYGWQLKGQVEGGVIVFEASIDAASYATFCVQDGDQYPDLLALGGLNAKPIEAYLDAHPETKSVLLALDTDEAGRTATKRFTQLLQARGVAAYDISGGLTQKDWNEELKWRQAQEAAAAQQAQAPATPEPAVAPKPAPLATPTPQPTASQPAAPAPDLAAAPAPAAAQAPVPQPAAPRPIANAQPVAAAPRPAAPTAAQAPVPKPAAPRPIANAQPVAAAPRPAAPTAAQAPVLQFGPEAYPIMPAAPTAAQAPAPQPVAPRPIANAQPMAAAPRPATAAAAALQPAAPRPIANAQPVAAAPRPATPAPAAAQAAAPRQEAAPVVPMDAQRRHLLDCVQYFRRYGDAIERGEAGLPPMPRIEDYTTAPQQAAQTPAAPQPEKLEPQQEKGFQLPPRAEDNKQLWAFLCKKRGLEHEVVREMIQKGALYESLGPDGSHNACFVRYDDAGKPCGASQLNLSTGVQQEAAGSENLHGWQLDGQAPEGVMVFQTPLDAASFASFYGSGATPRPDFLALGGLDFEPLRRYLDTHPEVRYVELALPTDELGRAAAHRFTALLQKRGIPAYELSEGNITHGKTWNEELQARRQQGQEASRSFSQGLDRSSPDTFCVCRLKDVDRVQRVLAGRRVKPRHYQPIHRDFLRPGDTPQTILDSLATGHPGNWQSLPMVNSDLLIWHQGGKDSAYLYTPQGLQERPDLLAAELQDPAPAPTPQLDEMEM